jgi:predicted transcriptional regulator
MTLIQRLRVLSHNEALSQHERETIYAAIRALGGNP